MKKRINVISHYPWFFLEAISLELIQRNYRGFLPSKYSWTY